MSDWGSTQFHRYFGTLTCNNTHIGKKTFKTVKKITLIFGGGGKQAILGLWRQRL